MDTTSLPQTTGSQLFASARGIAGMSNPREVAVTAGLSVGAMVFLFGALGFWIWASAARDPAVSGPVTVLSVLALVCALVGVVLFGIASRRVWRRFSG